MPLTLSISRPIPTPTHAKFERLKADHERLWAETQSLLETMRTLRRDVQTQFERTAHIQAVLDEERLSGSPYASPNPLKHQ